MPIWTPDIAYAVGLITTDGNLSKDRRHISLTSTEPQLLHTFKRCLSLRNKICINPSGSYSKNVCYKVTFSNVQFYEMLMSIGLMPNKTFKVSALAIPDGYFFDFLRGHLDGDGSIIHYIDRHNTYKNKRYVYDRLYITFRSGSLPHMQWLQNTIERLLHIRGSLTGWKRANQIPDKTSWILRFGTRDALNLSGYLYHKPDVPCLKRKRAVTASFQKKYATKKSVRTACKTMICNKG